MTGTHTLRILPGRTRHSPKTLHQIMFRMRLERADDVRA